MSRTIAAACGLVAVAAIVCCVRPNGSAAGSEQRPVSLPLLGAALLAVDRTYPAPLRPEQEPETVTEEPQGWRALWVASIIGFIWLIWRYLREAFWGE